MEDIVNLLNNSNLKLVEKETGIPYDRMYKWVKGKATPKTADYSILVKYFNNLNAEPGKSSNKDNELSENGNITLRANVKPLINNGSDFSDTERPNHNLGHTENSTYPDRNKSLISEYKDLYFGAQAQITLLNQQVERLNRILQKLN